MNVENRTLFIADNLDIMRGMDSESIDLIYLDPPFNSKRQYKAPIGSPAEGAEFKDIWTDEDVKDGWYSTIAEQYPHIHQIILAAEHTYDHSMMIYLMAMTIRLIEMRRILKSTGAIYLHCDPTASHYLKTVMDSLFGKNNFRNEIVWKSATGAKNNVTTRFGRGHDIILFYGMPKSKFNVQYEPLTEKYLNSHYTGKDEDGRCFQPGDLNAHGTGGHRYEFLGVTKSWRMTEEQAHKWLAEGRIVHHSITPGSRVNIPRYKRYADESKGRPALDNWTDIGALNSQAIEATGYPTQKPLTLLDRIIKASSNEGEVVFDPFCGCATTLVAADRLQRDWIGIDISAKAAELVVERIRDDQGLFEDIVARTDIPKRTDLGNIPRYNVPENKTQLYGEQGGDCNGCGEHFQTQHLEIDHIIARSVGGTDHIENLQLLCGHCNRIKGDRGQEYLISRLNAS